jgi:hypothetical protein
VPNDAGCNVVHVRFGLLDARPSAYGCKLDECEVIARELVIAGCHAPTVLNLVEEPFDQIASPVKIRAKA